MCISVQKNLNTSKHLEDCLKLSVHAWFGPEGKGEEDIIGSVIYLADRYCAHPLQF